MNKMKKWTMLIYILLTAICIAFVAWIGRMSYQNTCLELEEEYISITVQDKISSIGTSLAYGKKLDNYYGMQDTLTELSAWLHGKVRVVVTDNDLNPLYSSMEKNDESIAVIGSILSDSFKTDISRLALSRTDGQVTRAGNLRCLAFAIEDGAEEQAGIMLLLYDKDEMIRERVDMDQFDRQLVFWGLIICAAVALVMILLETFLAYRVQGPNPWQRRLPLIITLIAMLCYTAVLSLNYASGCERAAGDIADDTASYIGQSVRDLHSKGLILDDIGQVSEYIDKMVEGNRTIGNISVVQTYYNTETGSDIINTAITDNQYVSITLDSSFLEQKNAELRLMLAAILIVCILITYELTNLAQIITERIENRDDISPEGAGRHIRLLSFMAYTALYTSMPYAAVIMRKWNATVFGFSESVSASLPLTVELTCVLFASLIISRVFRASRLKKLSVLTFPVLILCNLACAMVSSPHALIALRALCGIGFAFLKYWLNSYVAAGSDQAEDVQRNYGMLNGGLLGGITVGASLGSILASAQGYQFNYFFTSAVCLIVLLIAAAVIPWKAVDGRRLRQVESARQNKLSTGGMLKDRGVRTMLILGAVPLNIGLMYVVSFLPVYMTAAGHSEIVTSYAYLVNGIVGVYGGVMMIRLLRKLPLRLGPTVSMLLAAAGILLLVTGSGAAPVLLSAGIMGLFDGYGTPTVTSCFTALPAVRGADKASMLTVFNGVGSAVQILCPLLYNILVEPDARMLRLTVFGLFYIAVAFGLLVLIPFKTKKEK